MLQPNSFKHTTFALCTVGMLISAPLGAAMQSPWPMPGDDPTAPEPEPDPQLSPYEEAIRCFAGTTLSYFTASTTIVDSGDPVVLRWSLSRPGDCYSLTIKVAGATVGTSGSRTVNPTNLTPYPKTKTYSITASMNSAVSTLATRAVTVEGLLTPPVETTSQPDTCFNCERPPYGHDIDEDDVDDRLEYDLAHRFFPNVIMNSASDKYETYLYNGHASPYTAAPLPSVMGCAYDETDPDDGPMCLEIRYAIAYHYDFGSPSACIGLVGCLGEHPGDSEFYAAVVRRRTDWASAQDDAGNWLMFGGFTAAHWGTGFDRSDVEYYSVNRSEPATVHASIGKHALYHSRVGCLPESCVIYGGYNLRNAKSGHLQNVGDEAEHQHAAMDTTIEVPDTDHGGYRFWDSEKFGDASPYAEHFTTPIDWYLPLSFAPGGGNDGLTSPHVE